MEVINGEWIMDGLDWSEEGCVHSSDELLEVIEEIGFLPLFSNSVSGFSVESRTDPSYWWTGDASVDPWEWRITLARTGKVAYGKFFGNKAGFISKKWFPDFANYRRDGYDFDARFDDGLAGRREKLIMDLFIPEGQDLDQVKKSQLEKNGCAEVLFTNEMKEKAGFGKSGEKNFEGTLAKLQMQSYLVAKDFRPRLNKQGEEYGWPIAVMTLPEYLWGYDFVTKKYSESPEKSHRRIVQHISKCLGVEESRIKV